MVYGVLQQSTILWPATALYLAACGQKFPCICLFGKKKIEHQAQVGDEGQKGLLCANLANFG
ncbi:hypothetical protein NHJ6243_001954 [Beauveria neobassiana]